MFPGAGISHKSDAHSLLRSPFSQRLDAQPGGGVAGEDLADADVPGEHLGRFVAGLAHDVALADPVHRRLGDASGAQAMAAQRLRLQAGAAGGPLHDPADAVLVEAAAGGPAMAVNSAECGTIDDAGTGQPAAQGAHRTGCVLLPKGNADLAASCLLVGLRAAQVNDQTVLGEGEVGKFDRGQLRAAEGAGEADQNEFPVAEARERLGARGNDPANVGGSKRSLTLLGVADRAADAFEGLAHDEVMARRGRLFKSRCLVGLGDRGQPAGNGGRAEGGGRIGDVEGDRSGSRREMGQVVFLAESGEVLEVGAVGAHGGRGFDGVNIGSRLLDQFFEAGRPRGQGKRWGLHRMNSV